MRAPDPATSATRRAADRAAPLPATNWFDRWQSGLIVTAIIALNHALMIAVLPPFPNNDTVSFVDLGHVSNAHRPVDHYAAPAHVPSVAEIPAVDAWRKYMNPCYGYPWLYLDLPENWDRDFSWLNAVRPPLTTDRLVPQNREWDNSFPVGGSLFFDAVMLLVPNSARAFALVALNHAFVLGTSVLLWRIGVELGWSGVGWLAGLLYGLQYFPGARAQELLTEPLFTLLDVGALHLFIRASVRSRLSAMAWAGVVLAAAFAVRAVAALQPAVIAATLLMIPRARAEWPRLTVAWAVPFAALVLALLVHNRIFYGRFAYTTGSPRHLFNRIVTVDRTLDANDPATQLIRDLAERPRLGGNETHPYQTAKIDVFGDSNFWSFYWMLRWQGLTVDEADGYFRRAALAAIWRDPLGFAGRSGVNVWRLGRAAPAPYITRFVDSEFYQRFLLGWFLPQARLAPYNWIAAQWRVFKQEIPLYGPSQILPAPARAALLAAWTTLPDLRTPAFYLAILGAALAAGRRQAWWMGIAGWALALLAVPAVLQTPNPRYGEPPAPLMVLLAVYAVGQIWDSITSRHTT